MDLARLLGIQTSYTAMDGKVIHTRPEVVRALLPLWGIDVDSGAGILEALKMERERRTRRWIEPVHVCWNGAQRKVSLKLPSVARDGKTGCMLFLEDGSCKALDLSRLVSTGHDVVEATLQLPRLPYGYHQLHVEHRGRVETSLVISAPLRGYSAPERDQSWGIFLPMYAVHSRASWGAGNIGDWERLSQWVGSLGGGLMATLPLLSGFLDRPVCEPSPYSPASRLFWNEFYLDIEKLPELGQCPAARKLVGSAVFQGNLQQFRNASTIDYQSQYTARRAVLEVLARFFYRNLTFRHRDFQQFLEERPTVTDYAKFRAACDKSGVSWHTWEHRLKHGKLEPCDYDQSAVEFHLYAQWQAERQFSSAIRSAANRDLTFYLDLPLGVNPDGYDVWRRRDSFAFPASAGAPPDIYFSEGQGWGFPPLHPERLRESRYSYVLDYLRFQMKHASMLRIDHVMGLHRLYWIPPGLTARDGAYVSYPAEELHAILSLESHRHKTMLVGENLGTVPPEVTKAMTRHGMRQTYVVQYELGPNPRKPVRTPPRLSVASLNTHDMPTFAAHWRGEDTKLRAELGLLRGDQITAERRRRGQVTKALSGFLRKRGLLREVTSELAVTEACLKWLAEGPAEFVLVNLEDLWSELEPQNVPGTSTECPNWRRKSRLSLEEIVSNAELERILSALTRRKPRRAASHAEGETLPAAA